MWRIPTNYFFFSLSSSYSCGPRTTRALLWPLYRTIYEFCARHQGKHQVGKVDWLLVARLTYRMWQLNLSLQGSIYAVDESTMFVKSFAYDGTGPDAFFWVGKTPRPSPEGYIIPYPEEYTGPYVCSANILLMHWATQHILVSAKGRRRFLEVNWAAARAQRAISLQVRLRMCVCWCVSGCVRVCIWAV